jgi:penicillin-binding protein 2
MRENEPIQGRNFQSWRLFTILGIVLIVFAYYIVQLFNYQIVHGAEYLARADDNRTVEKSISTQRGIIYDRNGAVLARNAATYNIAVTPAELPDDEGARQEIYRSLAEEIGIPASSGTMSEETAKLFKECENDLGVSQIVYIAETNWPYQPTAIRCGVDETTAMIIHQKSVDWPGISVEIETVREYPTGSLTAEIIGFLGPIPADREEEFTALGFIPGQDKVGYAGIEDFLQDTLAGKNGTRVVEVDVAGQVIRDLEPPVAAVPGNNVTLTIDTRLQQAAEAALIEQMQYWNNRDPVLALSSGVVVAMNPKTGEILTMVSYPSYENNRMSRFIPSYYYNQLQEDPHLPLLNKAISGEYPPGSVFKMATAVGILNEGVVTPEYQINDPGEIQILEKYSQNDPGKIRRYVCYDENGHGMVDFLKGVMLSCDVYFYKVGGGYKDEVKQGLGIWRIGEYARALGYGTVTGVELNGEIDGHIPDPTWKRRIIGESWSTGDTYISTIGQGYVLSTPMQVLMSFVTLANDGKLMVPHLVKQIRDSEGNVIYESEPEVRWDITVDPLITVYDENNFATEEKIAVQPWVIQKLKEGLRLVVTEGTSSNYFEGFTIPSAGKTGTAEYCDDIARKKNRCEFGSWPAHAWYVGYAPYDNPEIVVIAFVYNGNEGSSVTAPIVRKVLDAYFQLKAMDTTAGSSGQ